MIAASRSASAKTTFGDLPPSSSETFLRLPAAAWTISLPTSVEPVNATLSTSGWPDSAAPASPKPVTMLTTPSGRPASQHQLAEVERRQRRLLGGLEHDRAAAGQRRGELPRRHQQREVPGDDLADDADRLAQRVGEVLAGRRDRRRRRRGSSSASPPCSGTGPPRAATSATRAIPTGLPLSSDSSCAKHVGVLLDQVADPPDQLAALGRRHPPPRALVVEGAARRADRAVDVLGLAVGDLGERLLGRRVDRLEGAPRCRRHPLAVDQELAGAREERLDAIVDLQACALKRPWLSFLRSVCPIPGAGGASQAKAGVRWSGCSGSSRARRTRPP